MKKSMTVMFIDDSESDRVLFRYLLKSIDNTIEYITAIDGRDGLDKLIAADGNLPDYIFCDINMPRIDGMQFLEEIKSMEKLAHIPVIMYSTAQPSFYEKKAKKLGATQCLSKFMDLDDACKAVATIIVHHPEEH